MKEKLIIKNFGPIKEIELDLGRFNILIGEQATGKSTVAKVLAVCRYFSYILENDHFYFNEPFEDGLTAWGLSEAIQENTYIYYECKHYSFLTQHTIKIERWKEEDGSIVNQGVPAFESKLTPISEEFQNLLIELRKIIPAHPAGYGFDGTRWTIPYNFFRNDVKNVMDNPFYLPTERGLQSIFSLGQASIPNLENFLFNYFSKVDGAFRFFKTETEIEPLDIQYINRNGIGYVRKKGETEFRLLANAASGYQSTIPIVLIMKYQNEVRRRKKTFIIEEPELNLFPTAQEKLIQYLVEKTMNHGNTILLTTHSPYILASVNNLIYAHIVGQDNKEDVNNIVPEKYWLDPSLVSAYRLLPDGTARNIIDEDLKEVRVEELDAVGREINTIYYDISDIKFKKDEMSK